MGFELQDGVFKKFVDKVEKTMRILKSPQRSLQMNYLFKKQ